MFANSCTMESLWPWIPTLLLTILVIRMFWVLYNTGKPLSSQPRRPKRTLIVLGSGGHTAEILSLVRSMNVQQYAPRFYIAGATDKMSLIKAEGDEAQMLEDFWVQDVGDAERSLQTSRYSKIYRSREVGQSYVTSVFSTLWAFVLAVLQVLRIRPDIGIVGSFLLQLHIAFLRGAPKSFEILCNGPGTCLPVCVAGLLLKAMGLKWVVVIYVESICRVKKLSLTGLLLYNLRLADQLFVQWQELKLKYPRATYVGRLM